MAKAKNTMNYRGTTPTGIAIFPQLFEPDYKFSEDGVYHTKLKLTEAEAAPIIEEIEKVIQQARAEKEAECTNQRQKMAIKEADRSYSEELSDDGVPTGYVLFNFKRKASGVTKQGKKWRWDSVVFDAKGKPIINPDYQVWSGSKIRVAFELAPFASGAGVGCSQKIVAVQIVELATGGQSRDASAYGFGEEEGGFSDSTHTSSSFGESVREGSDGTSLDDLSGDQEGDF